MSIVWHTKDSPIEFIVNEQKVHLKKELNTVKMLEWDCLFPDLQKEKLNLISGVPSRDRPIRSNFRIFSSMEIRFNNNEQMNFYSISFLIKRKIFYWELQTVHKQLLLIFIPENH